MRTNYRKLFPLCSAPVQEYSVPVPGSGLHKALMETLDLLVQNTRLEMEEEGEMEEEEE